MNRTKAIYLHCMDAAGNETDTWTVLLTSDGHSITFSSEDQHPEIMSRHAIVYRQYECYLMLMTYSEYEKAAPLLREMLRAAAAKKKLKKHRGKGGQSGTVRCILHSRLRGLTVEQTAIENGLTLECVKKAIYRVYQDNGAKNIAGLIHKGEKKNIF